MITILNTSILTNYGEYKYSPITLEEARDMVYDGFISAIGHQSTANIISQLLGIDCAVNRIAYAQEPGETALIFKLNSRAPEGKILTISEIEKIGYSWGKLERLR